jgi:psiF repeat
MSASRLLISDTGLREDEHGELGGFLCEECETLNAGYGPCPYCTNPTECVVVRTGEGHLVTMARPLADSFRLALVQLGACRCCREYPSNPHRARIYAPWGHVRQLECVKKDHFADADADRFSYCNARAINQKLKGDERAQYVNGCVERGE